MHVARKHEAGDDPRLLGSFQGYSPSSIRYEPPKANAVAIRSVFSMLRVWAMKEMVGLMVKRGPPLRAVNRVPASTSSTVMTLPRGLSLGLSKVSG
jgi:hypothetical protein